MDLDKAIQSRKSVRKFTDKKPDWRDIIECIDAARYAPMAGNNYTLKFIIVKDPETIQKLADASQQPFVGDVHYVVIACSNPSRTINAYEGRGEFFFRQQAGAAIQNFLLKITEKGLSTCWTGYFVDKLVKKALDIPKDIIVEAMFPIGYENKLKGKKNPRRLKINIDRILYFEKYGNKKMNKIKPMDV